MNLTRSHLSLMITIFSMAILILTLYNIQLGAQQEEEYVIEMSLADEDIEELLQEKEQLEEALAQADPIKSHMAYNETAKPSYGNPEPLKTLEEIMEEREMNESNKDLLTSDAGFSANLKELAEERQAKKQELGEKEAQKKEYTNYLAEKRTSISYSLVDRNAYELPPPIYTCIEGGKVVINITVGPLGYVLEADYNSSSSTTANGCLIDNAISYAMKARFSASTKQEQIGTITYLFQAK